MIFKYLKDVSTLTIDPSRCGGCGVCAEVCPHFVFRIQGHKAHITDLDLCMECGACAKNCAAGALTVRAGVGCAAAIIHGKLRGTEPSCGCSQGECA
ncbi:MAG: mercury methylation ferredoxin HgcB [Acidobacteriota bacterium]|jgi:NAD-dependent dihydropyrimidine dehydrogenase PreA subunit